MRFPFTATLAGVPVVVTGVDFDGDERRGLVAVVERSDRAHRISLLDIEHPAEQEAALLLAAHKRWLGIS